MNVWLGYVHVWRGQEYEEAAEEKKEAEHPAEPAAAPAQVSFRPRLRPHIHCTTPCIDMSLSTTHTALSIAISLRTHPLSIAIPVFPSLFHPPQSPPLSISTVSRHRHRNSPRLFWCWNSCFFLAVPSFLCSSAFSDVFR